MDATDVSSTAGPQRPLPVILLLLFGSGCAAREMGIGIIGLIIPFALPAIGHFYSANAGAGFGGLLMRGLVAGTGASRYDSAQIFNDLVSYCRNPENLFIASEPVRTELRQLLNPSPPSE